MREYTVELAGRELSLGITWATSAEISEKVADLLLLTSEARTRALCQQAGLRPPKGEYIWTAKTVVDVIFIGAKHSSQEQKSTLEEIQELVFDAGLDVAHEAALHYIGNMMNPAFDTDLAKANAEADAKNKDKPSGE